MNEEHFAGIDIGSTMTKVVIMNESVAASFIGPTGAEYRRLANKVMEEALRKADLSFDQITYVVATGYGRISVPFADKQITEITCHARGVDFVFPSAKTVIDIGGQDSKGIKLNSGKVVDFVMNDKCAAGTGRFLEVIAEALGIKLGELGEISLRSQQPVEISNTCTVFAEQEVVARLAEGVSVEDIVAGIHDGIASRVSSMVARISVQADVVITGGGAKNIGLVKALERRLGHHVLVPTEPLLTGAIGAALLGKELSRKMTTEERTMRKERRLEEATFFS